MDAGADGSLKIRAVHESQAPANSLSQPTLHYVDGVRAVCALFVLVAHTWFQPANGYYAERWMNKLGLSYSHLAVDAFIVVSGFVIGLPIARSGDRIKSLPRFLKRRATRILPPYYAALFLAVAFILLGANRMTGTVWDNSLPLTWQRLLLHVSLLQNLPFAVPGGSISYQLWSIAVEFQIYLLAPLLVLLARKTSYAFCIALTLALSFLVHRAFPALDLAWHWYVALFAMGAAAARATVRTPELAGKLFWPGMAALGLAGGSILLFGNAFFKSYIFWIDVAVGAGVTGVVAGLAGAEKNPLRRVLEHSWLAGIGRFSYSLYLIHPMLLHLIWLGLKRTTSFDNVELFFAMVALNPLIVLAAWAFYRAFERPFMVRR
jgi:peptidoglycan/LPS O-acetylase OafA/YrhL